MLTHFAVYTQIAFFILLQNDFSVLSYDLLLLTNATTLNGSSGPHAQALVASPQDSASAPLPVFPERPDAVYFVVAVVGGGKLWGRTLAKTLLDLGAPFNNPQGPPLRPIFVDLPQNGRFSSKVLTTFCQQVESKPLAGVIVIGEGQSARSVALAGTAMKMPVLWAKGGTASLNGKHKEIETPFQALLQPSAKEILEAVRAIFLQTHWHSFFVLADVEAAMVLKSVEGESLRESPLVSSILALPAKEGSVFRQLAQISKSTRGVVLMLCNLDMARKIMREAQRLNMVGGHFIWLWADTSSTTEFYDVSTEPISTNPEKMDFSSPVRGGGGRKDGTLFDHMEHLEERKMDFEDFNTVRRPEKEQDRGQDGSNVRTSKRERNSGRKKGKTKSEENQRGRRVSRGEERVPNIYNESDNNEEDEEEDVVFEYESDESAGGAVENKQNPVNATTTTSDSEIWPRLSPRNPFIDAEKDNIDPVSYEESKVSPDDDNLKPKRNPTTAANVTDSHVLFHHFKDFPIGLLALRPIRMNVDRHFIRSVVRLFASSWARLEFDANNYGSNFNANVRNRNSNNHRTKEGNQMNVWSGDEPQPNAARATATNARHRPAGKRSIYQQLNSNDSDRNNNDKDNRRRSSDTTTARGREGGVFNESMVFNQGSSSINSGIGEALSQNTNNGAQILTEQRVVNSSSSSSSTSTMTINSDSIRQETDDTQTQQQKPKNQSFNTSDLTPVNYNDKDSVSSDLHLIKTQNTNSAIRNNNDKSGLHLNSLTKLKDDYDDDDYDSSKYNLMVGQRSNSDRDSLQSNINQIRKPGPMKRQHSKDTWRTRSTLWQKQSPMRKLGGPQYKGGCYGSPNKGDLRRAEHFAKILQHNVELVLGGERLGEGGLFEKSLTAHFELLNLVPINKKTSSALPPMGSGDDDEQHKSGLTKWRRVGQISGSTVHLDTIVWPGGDIVVSGLSARARSVFRVVTALAPPFVMVSELDEDGLCLRGLPCHRLSGSGRQNLTLIFNAIETRDRLEQDAIEHGRQVPEEKDEDTANQSYRTKCCYGLSMDLLENVATELGFEFHLYLVRDELYGAKYVSKHQKYEATTPFDGEEINSEPGVVSTGSEIYKSEYLEEENPFGSHQSNKAATIHRKYYMNEEKIFGRKNEHIFYKDDGHRNELNRDFGYMEKSPLQQSVAGRPGVGNRKATSVRWNGIIGDLIAGSADMSFAALSVSKARAEAIDFSMPYFHSGVSLLAAPQTKSEIPLLAFLLPFSPELWIAIFTSLNITAIAVAVYEWLSPFGLNPWGRQRNKNFSMSSALWVMWGLLCGHLVAFKAPKSWPNKFLINVWGGFSVIFVASYTANIAALIAGLFFHNAANKFDASLLTQRVGTPIASAAESYVQKNDRHLWEHMKKYSLHSIQDGIRGLRNGSLDLMMADSPILDYYRATDHGCNLQRVGETYVEDAYAIGMTKGFPLKESISELIAKYSSNGYLDILTEKWYGGLPCFKLDNEIAQPRPLGVAAVAGVFLLLGLGMILGVLILIFEHLFYKYTLPILRHKPKDTVWKSPNIMFFSQKLYRFINCAELVSPHHAARELVHTLRQGQIASLFQKSIKRKEDEQRRRRKSKAQFFEMIQEIRRINFLSRVQQQHERERDAAPLPAVQEVESSLEMNAILSPDKLQKSQKVSPKPKISKKESRSRSNSSGLNVRRFSTDSILGERLDTIGRRLSRDITNSPPDLGRRFETFGKGNSDTLAVTSLTRIDKVGNSASAEVLNDSNSSKFDTYSGPGPSEFNKNKKLTTRRSPLNLEVFESDRVRKKSAESIDIMPTLKERLAPPICILEPNKAVLREKLHDELRSKYGPNQIPKPPRRPLPLPPDDDEDEPPSGHQGKVNKPQTLNVANTYRPTPSPRGSNRDLDSNVSTKHATRSRKNGKSKLSREDLMKISQGSQAEIHEYLSNSMKGRMAADPP